MFPRNQNMDLNRLPVSLIGWKTSSIRALHPLILAQAATKSSVTSRTLVLKVLLAPSICCQDQSKTNRIPGDGVTDDTAAINNAISSGNRCAPGKCQSSTTTPAVVYFPAGTYIISSSIIDYYFTQIIGNPNSLPILRATPDFKGLGLIDSNPYQSTGNLGFGATNVLYVLEQPTVRTVKLDYRRRNKKLTVIFEQLSTS